MYKTVLKNRLHKGFTNCHHAVSKNTAKRCNHEKTAQYAFLLNA